MENIDIGKKIEKQRKEKGLTSKELANMAEITPSMLSQIERGSANPSIQTLKVLAKALDVPTFSFLLEETNTDDLIVRSHKRKKMIIDNLSYEMLSPNFTGNLATAIMTVPPNTSSSDNVLEHKGEELAFVLDGTITLYLNEEEYTLETGDSVKIPAYLKHKWVNQLEKNAIVLFSVTPPIF
ncbi:helix-turn-helix domain-containing protein [Bacillus toyonensis]|uniref:helix-turn-helix domain-containing protein n=1 Tax=Bacillus toyonensis TaxID=155322 RepID=UPI000B43BC84|nr:XRE family transcriptional regulator [Bacillus toyonensis]OTX34213.1 DNA-binding protein [Bacillus thuringiensis serovar malayensis]OUB11176.1 DNA-binding protein [Bacillus thuringiensis serovar shandongiensis]MBX0353410.1 XRE family transcriptional regulator [Bacillus toyonensis]MDM5255480.1 XRE family transcriptional regulator [Bacillus toyonensis]MEC2393626.1 XRE family transcriptional regulator [Bacillus toyonensis]